MQSQGNPRIFKVDRESFSQHRTKPGISQLRVDRNSELMEKSSGGRTWRDRLDYQIEYAEARQSSLESSRDWLLRIALTAGA